MLQLPQTTGKGDPETFQQEKVNTWKQIDGTQFYNLGCLKCHRLFF